MYFNGKSYFNQEQNMRVIRNQKNPPPRRKGRTKKKVIKRKVDSKVDMRKLKSLFGSDIIVKLLLSLVDRKAQGPNLKKERKTRPKSMRISRGGNFQTSKQVKVDRDKREKMARVEKASIKAPGETDEDVSLRMMKEVIAGDNPAVSAFLQANKIPRELRRLQGNLVVLGEAYFDKKTTGQDKKAIERNILKQVIEGIGGEVRKDFLTSVEESEAVKGIKEAVDLLKKETGISDPEKIIQQKDKITEDIKKKVEKGKISEEKAEIVLDGIDAVEELKTTDIKNIQLTITENNIENIVEKKKAGGRVKETPDKVKKDLLEYMVVLNPNLETDESNREYFVNYIDEQIGEGKGKSQIKKLITTQNKRLLSGKLKTTIDEVKQDKKTRADAGIFLEGAIAGEPYAYNITLESTGERRKFDLLEMNGRAKYIKTQLDKFNNRLDSDITSKNKKAFEKELDGHFAEFRNQLKAKAEARDYELKPDYSTNIFSPDEIAEDTNDLIQDFAVQGIGLPSFKLYKGEQIYSRGPEGIVIKDNTEGTYRYIDYSQKEYKKELDKQAKQDKREKFMIAQTGAKPSGTATEMTELEQLLDSLPIETQKLYKAGNLSTEDFTNLNPRLQIAYKDYEKGLKKKLKKLPKGSEALVPYGSEVVENKPGFFKNIFGSKKYSPKIEKESETLGFTNKGEEIKEGELSKKLKSEDKTEVKQGFDSVFDIMDTMGDDYSGDLLEDKPELVSSQIRYRDDFVDAEGKYSEELYQNWRSKQVELIGSGEYEGQTFSQGTELEFRPKSKDVIEKEEADERSDIIRKYKNSGVIERSERNKLTKPDRKKIGLLTDEEVSELSEKEKNRYGKIKIAVEGEIAIRNKEPEPEPQPNIQEVIVEEEKTPLLQIEEQIPKITQTAIDNLTKKVPQTPPRTRTPPRKPKTKAKTESIDSLLEDSNNIKPVAKRRGRPPKIRAPTRGRKSAQPQPKEPEPEPEPEPQPQPKEPEPESDKDPNALSGVKNRYGIEMTNKQLIKYNQRQAEDRARREEKEEERKKELEKSDVVVDYGKINRDLNDWKKRFSGASIASSYGGTNFTGSEGMDSIQRDFKEITKPLNLSLDERLDFKDEIQNSVNKSLGDGDERNKYLVGLDIPTTAAGDKQRFSIIKESYLKDKEDFLNQDNNLQRFAKEPEGEQEFLVEPE